MSAPTVLENVREIPKSQKDYVKMPADINNDVSFPFKNACSKKTSILDFHHKIIILFQFLRRGCKY